MSRIIVLERKIRKEEEVEELWLQILELFGSDYAVTYRDLLNRERAGEAIANFTGGFGWLVRGQTVLRHMPCAGDTGQNIPEWGEGAKVLAYSSRSGRTKLLLSKEEGETFKIRLEMRRLSSFPRNWLEELGEFFNVPSSSFIFGEEEDTDEERLLDFAELRQYGVDFPFMNEEEARIRARIRAREER